MRRGCWARWMLLVFAVTASAPAATFTVQIAPGGSLSFSPAVQPIDVGDTVHWVWADSGHSTTSGNPCTPNGLWDSGVQATPFSFDFTFTAPGTYNYFCSVHCFAGMTGTIVVSAPAPTPTPGPGGSAVPALSPALLAVLGVLLAIGALFLLRKS